MTDLAGHRILMFVGDAYEDLELWYPKLRMEEAGAEVVLAGQKANTLSVSYTHLTLPTKA